MGREWIVVASSDKYVVLIACGLAVAFYIFGQGSELLGYFSSIGIPTYMLAASLVGIFTYFKLGPSKFTNTALGYALGLLTWALGLIVYLYAYFITDIGLSYISIADLFYLLSYPAWMLGTLGVFRLFGRAIGRTGWTIVAAVGIVLYTFIILYVVPSSIAGLESPIEAFVTALYPTLDVAFFLMTLAVFIAFREGIFEKAFSFMALGAGLLAVGDLIYAVLSVSGLYHDGHPADLLLFFGCATAGYGFWRQYIDLNKLK